MTTVHKHHLEAHEKGEFMHYELEKDSPSKNSSIKWFSCLLSKTNFTDSIIQNGKNNIKQ